MIYSNDKMGFLVPIISPRLNLLRMFHNVKARFPQISVRNDALCGNF
jgi:hypothetical protein